MTGKAKGSPGCGPTQPSQASIKVPQIGTPMRVAVGTQATNDQLNDGSAP